MVHISSRISKKYRGFHDSVSRYQKVLKVINGLGGGGNQVHGSVLKMQHQGKHEANFYNFCKTSGFQRILELFFHSSLVGNPVERRACWIEWALIKFIENAVLKSNVQFEAQQTRIRQTIKVGKGFWISKHTQAKNSVRKLLSCKHRPLFMEVRRGGDSEGITKTPRAEPNTTENYSQVAVLGLYQRTGNSCLVIKDLWWRMWHDKTYV